MLPKKFFLIYDPSRVVARFVKIKYSKEYTIESLIDLKEINVIDFDKYDFGIFVINDSYDIINFLIIQNKIKFWIIGSTITDYAQIIKKGMDIPFLDLTKNKKEIYDNLNLCINLFD